MEDMKHSAEDTAEKAAKMTDAEKEQVYLRAVGYLTSSLTNDELFEESLAALLALGEYKDSAVLYRKYTEQFAKRREEGAALAKKRKASRIFQAIAVGLGFAVVLGLILLLVYALKLDIVR